MNILIVYETYSGGTQAAAEYISKIFADKGYSTTIKRAADVTVNEFAPYEIILFATPSWLEREQEGQPHINFLKLIDSSVNADFKNKKFILMGLGDETYAHFCNGVNILEKFIKDKGGTIIGKPLKIDSYYVDPSKHEATMLAWIQQLPLN